MLITLRLCTFYDFPASTHIVARRSPTVHRRIDSHSPRHRSRTGGYFLESRHQKQLLATSNFAPKFFCRKCMRLFIVAFFAHLERPMCKNTIPLPFFPFMVAIRFLLIHENADSTSYVLSKKFFKFIRPHFFHLLPWKRVVVDVSNLVRPAKAYQTEVPPLLAQRH